MIEVYRTYLAMCDRCKTRYFGVATERVKLEKELRENGWLVDDHGCMCPECRKKRSGL